MSKFHIIVVFLFGFLLIPNGSFACESNSSKKEISSKICNEDCCKIDNHSKTKNHDGCAGKCQHSKCGCITATCYTSFSTTECSIEINSFILTSAKQNFYDYEKAISPGFNSLWLIPKIG